MKAASSSSCWAEDAGGNTIGDADLRLPGAVARLPASLSAPHRPGISVEIVGLMGQYTGLTMLFVVDRYPVPAGAPDEVNRPM
jgi:hypothetical protein